MFQGAGALESVVKAPTGVVLFYNQHLFCDALRSRYAAQAVDGKRAVTLSIGNVAVGVGSTGVGYVVAAPVAELLNVGRICRARCRVCNKRFALALQFLPFYTAQYIRAFFTRFNRTQLATAI